MEQMVAGGSGSALGNPASGQIGSHGNQIGNTDFWNPGSNVIAHPVFGKIQKRNLNSNKSSGKNKKK